MSKIAVMTDSNSGFTQDKARELGVYILPMPVYINGELYYDGVTLTNEAFYEKLADDTVEISTSQPSPGEMMDMWDKLLEKYDEVVVIPMSSALSGTVQTAQMLAEDYDGKVQIVDNQRISVTLMQAVAEAYAMAEAGKSAVEIKELLEKDALESSIYLSIGTLKYLKKGGRVTPAVAAIGSLLKIRPVLQIQGGKIDTYSSKCRGMKASKKNMIEAIREDLNTRFSHLDPVNDLAIGCAYGSNYEEGAAWKKEVMEAFPEMEIYEAELSLSVACHIGPEVLGVTLTKKTR